MIRVLSALSVLLALASAFELYAVKYDTRQLDLRLQAKERAIEKLEGDIAVLRAERAYLARPERIERLARRQGLAPINPQQYVRERDLAASLDGSAASAPAAGKAKP